MQSRCKNKYGRKGRFMDNIFIEPLWRSHKYECIYLHARSRGQEAKVGIGKSIEFYSHKRPHTVHNSLTPDVAYWTNRHQKGTAKNSLIKVENCPNNGEHLRLMSLTREKDDFNGKIHVVFDSLSCAVFSQLYLFFFGFQTRYSY